MSRNYPQRDLVPEVDPPDGADATVDGVVDPNYGIADNNVDPQLLTPNYSGPSTGPSPYSRY